MKTLNLICFLLTFAAVFAAAVRRFLRARRAEDGAALPDESEEQNKITAKGERALLALILLFALAIRLWRFGAVPGGVNQDGVMAAVDAKALADYGTDRFGTRLPAHLYAWGYGQMSSLLSYLIAPLVKLAGLNVVTMRLPLLIVSMAGIVFFYLLMRELFGAGTGLAAAAFAAVDPWHFVQSRWALDCNLLPHFFVAAMYFFARAMREEPGGLAQAGRTCWLGARMRSLYAAMLCFGLCMYCYGVTLYIVVPLLFALAAYCLAKKRLKVRELLVCAGVYLLVAWPFLLTMAINFFRWDTIELPFVTLQRFPDSVRSSDILFFSDEPLLQLWRNLRSLLRVTLLQKPDLLWNEVPGFGTVYLCTMPFVFAGFPELRRARTGSAFVLPAMLLAGVLGGLLTNGVNINRINMIYYSIMGFAVLGMRFAARELRFLRPGCVGLYALLAAALLASYFGPYADMIRGCFYDGFGEALAAAEQTGSEMIYVTADTQFEGSANVSEILTLFYDETDAEYFQGKADRSGDEDSLPYAERFTYLSFTEKTAARALENGAACVIRADDAKYFDPDKFLITPYGDYCMAEAR